MLTSPQPTPTPWVGLPSTMCASITNANITPPHPKEYHGVASTWCASNSSGSCILSAERTKAQGSLMAPLAKTRTFANLDLTGYPWISACSSLPFWGDQLFGLIPPSIHPSGNQHVPWKSNIEDDFPFPKVRHVSSRQFVFQLPSEIDTPQHSAHRSYQPSCWHLNTSEARQKKHEFFDLIEIVGTNPKWWLNGYLPCRK